MVLEFAKIYRKKGDRYKKKRKIIESYFENPFCIRHGISNDETGQSYIGSRLRKDHGLWHSNVGFASKVFGIHILPKFICKSFWLRTRGRICIEPPIYHPVTKILQMTIAVPGITVKLKEKTCSYQLHILVGDGRMFSVNNDQGFLQIIFFQIREKSCCGAFPNSALT